MIHDLRNILDGWEYEPGKISVRKIIGQDGREKIQTRVDLGLLQCETTGRPDGLRPKGADSLLDYLERKLREYVDEHGSDAGFKVAPDDCEDLRVEGRLYYQRYLALFVLEEFDGVERDTSRNLRLIDFCHRYAATDRDRKQLESQRAYVLMMNARARAYRALQGKRYQDALDIVNAGIRTVRDLGQTEEMSWESRELPELNVLLELRDEVLLKMPKDAAPRLKWELQVALEREDYEAAARLRDQLSRQSTTGDAA